MGLEQGWFNVIQHFLKIINLSFIVISVFISVGLSSLVTDLDDLASTERSAAQIGKSSLKFAEVNRSINSDATESANEVSGTETSLKVNDLQNYPWLNRKEADICSMNEPGVDRPLIAMVDYKGLGKMGLYWILTL
ncbi:MAG: hypothetical protein ACFFB3_21400, partial [Candidatus Hodarchaeota archaeon]